MERNKATKEQQNRELVGNSLELIGNQAICTCTNGSVPAQLNVVSQQKVFCNGGTRLIATNADKDVRSLNFGNCKAKNNAPCTACVKWSKVYNKIIVTNAFLPLTMKSEALCTSGGGKISFLTSGQQVIVIPPTSLKDANSIAYASPLLEESDMKREVKEERKEVDTPQKEYSKTAFVNGVRVNGVKTLSLRVNSQEELVFTNTLTENADPSTPIKWEVVYEGKNGENKTTILEAPPSRELFREEGTYKVYAYVKNRGSRLGGGYVLITVSTPRFINLEWKDSNGRTAKYTSRRHLVYAHLKFEGVKDIPISAKIYYFGTERKEYITASPIPLQIDEGGNAKIELSLKYNQVAKMKEDREPLKAKCKFYIELESNEWIENDKAIKDTPIEYTDDEEISSMFLYEDQACTKQIKGFIECGNTVYAKVSTRNLDNDTLTLFIFRHTVVEEENEEIKGTVYRQEKEIEKDGVVVFQINTSEAWLIPGTSNSFDVFVLEGSFKDEIVVSPQGCWLEPNTSKYFRSGKDKGLIILSPKREAIKEGQSITVVQEVKKKEQEQKICICKEYDLIYGQKVSCGFRKKVVQICSELWGEDNKIQMANKLMAVMEWESGGTFSSGVPNIAGSKGTGLIQFMPDTARRLLGIGKYGTGDNKKKDITIENTNKYFNKTLPRIKEFASMTALGQLDYVKKYFEPLKGRNVEFIDFYLQVLFPASSMKPDHIVFAKSIDSLKHTSEKESLKKLRVISYKQNRGLDINKDGLILKSEIAKKVQIYMIRGLAYKEHTFVCDKETIPYETPLSKSTHSIIKLIRKWEYNSGINSTSSTVGEFCVSDDPNIHGYIAEPYGPSSKERGLDKRIPVGEYNLKWRTSTAFGKNKYKKKKITLEYGFPNLYNEDVPSDRGILIHIGNTGKDTTGCLLPGDKLKINGKNTIVGVSDSTGAFVKLIRYLESKGIENVKLVISENYEKVIK